MPRCANCSPNEDADDRHLRLVDRTLRHCGPEKTPRPYWRSYRRRRLGRTALLHFVRSADRTTGAGRSPHGRRKPIPTQAASACRPQGRSTCCSVSLSAPADTLTTCPLFKVISRIDCVFGTLADGGTSVNTTWLSAGVQFPASSPAGPKTYRHQVRVPSWIPRCCPNSRSVNPPRCQRANTTHHARTDSSTPSSPWIPTSEPDSALSAPRKRRCTCSRECPLRCWN